MTVQIKVEVPNLDKMARQLSRYPSIAMPIHDKATLDASRALEEVTKSNPRTPVDTGRMRASINHRKLRRLAAATFVGVNYGAYVHEGTRFMKAQPFFKWALGDGGRRAIEDIFRRATEEVNRRIFGSRGSGV